MFDIILGYDDRWRLEENSVTGDASLFASVGADPADELRGPGVDTGVLAATGADSPGSDAHDVSSTTSGAAGVTLLVTNSSSTFKGQVYPLHNYLCWLT